MSFFDFIIPDVSESEEIMSTANPQTMFEKIWNHHIVHAEEGKQTILYIDLQLVHEVTSPQAFEGLRMNNRQVRRTDKTFAVPDHNVPTTDRSEPIQDEIAKKQIDTLRQNANDFGVTLFDVGNDFFDVGVHSVFKPPLAIDFVYGYSLATGQEK